MSQSQAEKKTNRFARSSSSPTPRTDLLRRHSSTRRLRSADAKFLTPQLPSITARVTEPLPRSPQSSVTYLPLDIRYSVSLISLKSQVKCHLFKMADSI